MGFDLYGLRAKSKTGEYFRNNVWWWRPLADYVVDVCHLSAKGWDYNDGHKISPKKALEIADKLDELIKSGEVKKYSKQYDKDLKALPLVECGICNGTGERHDDIVNGQCNGCLGKGQVKDWKCSYPFSVENVKEFSKFCRESGGFTIN